MALNWQHHFLGTKLPVPVDGRASSCKRPLPPPDARESVLRQIKNVTDWTLVDSLEDVYVSLPRKKVKGYIEGPGDKHPVSSSYKAISTANVECRKCDAEKTSPKIGNVRKRLFQSYTFRPKIEPINGMDTKQASPSYPDDTSFPQSNSAVSSLNQFDLSKSIILTNGENAPSIDESEWDEAVRLAKTTENDGCASEEGDAQVSCKEPQPRPTKNDIAREQLEIAGQTRSRELREQALARQTVQSRKPGIGLSLKASNSPNTRRDHSQEYRDRPLTISQGLPLQQSQNLDQSLTEPPVLRVSSVTDVDRFFDAAEFTSEDLPSPNSWGSNRFATQERVQKQLHPASRAAAERFRTQDRHLAKEPTAEAPSTILRGSLENNEQRLLQLKSQTFDCVSNVNTSPLHETRTSSEAGSQHEAEVESNVPVNQHQSPVRSLPDSNMDPKTVIAHGKSPAVSPGDSSRPPGSRDESPMKQYEGASIETQWPLFPPLRPEPSAKLSPQPQAAVLGTVLKTSVELDIYAREPPGLTLPPAFDRLDHKLQDLIKESETCKERVRDLEAIIPVYEQISLYGALHSFSEAELAELSVVQEYVRAVLDEGLSGKTMRKRIGDIRRNMKRRIQKHLPAEVNERESLLNKLLTQARREQIKQSITDLHVRIEYLRIQRGEAMSKRHSKTLKKPSSLQKRENQKAKQKQVHFALDNLNNLEQRLPCTAGHKEGASYAANQSKEHNLTGSETRRLAQYAAADKKIALLEARLALFDKPSEAGNEERCEDSQEAQSCDDDSVISEEEEGAELFSVPVGLMSQQNPAQDKMKESVEDNEHRHDESGQTKGAKQQTSQMAHEGLILAMKQKEEQRTTSGLHDIPAQGHCAPCPIEVQEPKADPDGAEANSRLVSEFEDIDVGDDGNGDRRRCYRYVLNAQFSNVPGYEDGCEYTGVFLDNSKAVQEQDRVVEELRKLHSQSLASGETPTVHEQLSEELGLRTRSIDFGSSSRSSCRVWITKEEFAPDQEAYENARIRRACFARPVYVVLWRRVVTPAKFATDDTHAYQASTVADTSISVENNSAGALAGLKDSAIPASDDDLFGPDPPSPLCEQVSEDFAVVATVPSAQPVTTSISFDALRHFSNIAGANRHAKKVFMAWYMDHLSGRDNWREIARTDQATEEELESYGDWTMWEREDEFDVYTDDGDDDGDGDGDDDDADIGHVGEGDQNMKRMTTTEDPSSTCLQDASIDYCTHRQQQQQQQQRLVQNDRFRVWVERKSVSGPAN